MPLPPSSSWRQATREKMKQSQRVTGHLITRSAGASPEGEAFHEETQLTDKPKFIFFLSLLQIPAKYATIYVD